MREKWQAKTDSDSLHAQSSWSDHSLDEVALEDIFLAVGLPDLLPEFLGIQQLRRNGQWRPMDVYDFLGCRRVDLASGLVPRLVPLRAEGTDRTAARFLFAQHVETDPHGLEFVVHAWDPSDGRGRIGVSYPVRDCPGAASAVAAMELRSHLPWASAVVVPADDEPHDVRRAQPALWLADRRSVHLPAEVDVGVERCQWSDLSRVLNTEIPWWSFGLRDRDEMLAWRPGDPQTVVPPGTFTRDPRALTAVLTDDSSPALRRVVARMADEVAIEVCGEYRKHDGHDHYHGVAGLRQAAVAGLGCSSGPPKPRSAGEASLFLHHEVANPITAAHAAAVAGGIPAITGVHIVNGDNDSHPMVQAWLGRLQPARRHDELGFHVARMHLPTELLSAAADVETRYFSDPYWPDCWIVSEGLTVVATVGTSVPARGCLAQAYVDVQAAFFTDEAGVAWPLPVPTGGRERQNFNHTVGQLITDAGTDVDKVSSDAESGPLDWASIPLPVVIDADGSYYRW